MGHVKKFNLKFLKSKMDNFLDGFEILVGTYEEFVLGFKPEKSKKFKQDGDDTKKDQITLVPSFTNHAHSGVVRCVGAGGKFCVSGGGDELVKVFNLRNRSEHGDLHHHDGTVNAAVFFDNGKYLFTASEDRNICILKTSTWRVEKTLCKHQAGVVAVAVHPSGKLALSVGRDRKLVTWNLIKGRTAYIVDVKEAAEFVKWSEGEDASRYALGFYKRLDVYDVATAAIAYTVDLSSKGRASDVAFWDDDLFFVASAHPNVQVHSVKAAKMLNEFEAHEKRVRCLKLIRDSKDENSAVLISVSNDGFVKVWSVKRKSDEIQVDLLGKHDTKCRITCLDVHKVPELKTNSENPEGKSKKDKTAKRKSSENLEKSEVKNVEVKSPGKKKKKK